MSMCAVLMSEKVLSKITVVISAKEAVAVVGAVAVRREGAFAFRFVCLAA